MTMSDSSRLDYLNEWKIGSRETHSKERCMKRSCRSGQVKLGTDAVG